MPSSLRKAITWGACFSSISIGVWAECLRVLVCRARQNDGLLPLHTICLHLCFRGGHEAVASPGHDVQTPLGHRTRCAGRGQRTAARNTVEPTYYATSELIRNELAELSEIIAEKNADKLDAYLTRLRDNIGQGDGMK